MLIYLWYQYLLDTLEGIDCKPTMCNIEMYSNYNMRRNDIITKPMSFMVPLTEYFQCFKN